jgi:hypothetical protein
MEVVDSNLSGESSRNVGVSLHVLREHFPEYLRVFISSSFERADAVAPAQ